MYQETKELTVTTAPRTGKWTRLANAIRRGCAIRRKQAFGVLWTNDDAACAIGAAIIGGFGGSGYECFPLREPLDCPHRITCGEMSYMDLNRLIQHLNDGHHLSREYIADWLDSI